MSSGWIRRQAGPACPVSHLPTAGRFLHVWLSGRVLVERAAVDLVLHPITHLRSVVDRTALIRSDFGKAKLGECRQSCNTG